MMNWIRKPGSYLSAGKRRKAVVRALAFAVVFITTYSLVLPAITKTSRLRGELDGVEVRVEAGEGALPSDASLSLKKVLLPGETLETDETDGTEEAGDPPRGLTEEEAELILAAAREAVDGAASAEPKILRALDISLAWNGSEIEPSKAVRLSLKSDLIARANYPVIVHLRDDGIAELVDITGVPDGTDAPGLQWMLGEDPEEPPDSEPPVVPDVPEEAEKLIPGGKEDTSGKGGEAGPEESGETESDEGGKLDPDAGNGNVPNVPSVGVPSDDAPGGGAPSADAPSDDAPGGDAPSADAPSDDAPGGGAPSVDAPSDNTSNNNTPSVDTSNNDTSSSGFAANDEISVVATEFSVYAIVDLYPEIGAADAGPDTVQFAGGVGDMLVTVTAPMDAFPEGTVMELAAVEDEAIIEQVSRAVEETAEDEAGVSILRAVDISFYYDGGRIEPEAPVNVVIKLTDGSGDVIDTENSVLVTIGKTETGVAADAELERDRVRFDSDEPAICAIAEISHSGSTPVIIAKTADKKEARAGETVKYAVGITNQSGGQITVDFSDDLADNKLELQLGSIYVDGENALRKDTVETDTGFSLREPLTIEAGETASIVYSATVKKDAGIDTTLTNTAAAAVDGTQYTDSAGVKIKEAALSVGIGDNIQGADGKKTVRSGDEVIYTVDIRNKSGERTDVTFSSDLAGGQMDLISASVTVDGEPVDSDKVIVTETGFALLEPLTIAAGDATAITYTAVVNGTAKAGNPLTNTITLTEAGTNYSYTFSYDGVSVEANEGLEITKTADKAAVMPGGEVTYTVTVKNNDDENISVEFSDDLAGGRLRLKEDSVRVNVDTAAVKRNEAGGFTLAEPFQVMAGGTVTVRYAAAVPEDAEDGAALTNTAAAKAGNQEESAGCMVTVKDITVQISEGDLAKYGYLEAVLYAKGGPMALDGDVTYTYTWYKIPCTLVSKASGFKELHEGTPEQIQTITTNRQLYAFSGSEAVVEAPNKYYVEVTWEEDGAPVTVKSAEYQAHYYTELQNGSFETPVVVGADGSNYHYIIVYANDGVYSRKAAGENGGETIDGDAGSILDFVWQSTTNNFELFDIQSFGDDDVYFHLIKNQSIPNGNQAAEVNADDEGILYQALLTRPGTVIHWGFSHRGRAGEDTVGVYIGGNDPGAFDISGDFVGDYSTDNDRWWFYSGEYVVPNGQYVTYFSLQAKEAKANEGNGKLTIGNLIDYVQVTTKPIQYPPAELDFDYWIVKYVDPFIWYDENGEEKEAGQDWTGCEFTFEIELVSGNPQAVFVGAGSNKQPFTKQTMTLTSWAMEFPIQTIMVTDAGTYEFTVRELVPDGYSCDTGMYRIIVEVGPGIDGSEGLGARFTYYKDGEPITKDKLYNEDAFRFNNYTWYEFTKENDKELVWPGDEVHYTARFTNKSGGDLTVEFSDDLANGQLDLAPGSVTLDLGLGAGPVSVETESDGTGFRLKDAFTVGAGKTAAITYTATVNDKAEPGKPVVNTAKAVEGRNVLKDTAEVNVRRLFLKKTGDEDTKKGLEGAVFTLYSDLRCAEAVEGYENLTTGEDGVICLDGLENGDYYLKELTAPEGYLRMTGAVIIRVTDGTIQLLDKRLGEGEEPVPREERDLPEDGCTLELEDGVWTLTVINHAGRALPETGGISARFYVLGGLALMGAAYPGLRAAERRRRGRAG